MKRDIVVIRANGMKSQEIGQSRSTRCWLQLADHLSVSEEILQSTSYRGFPVVRSEEDRTILGFLRKTELAYALGQCKQERHRRQISDGRSVCESF
jgi:chloride channel 3/4/5